MNLSLLLSRGEIVGQTELFSFGKQLVLEKDNLENKQGNEAHKAAHCCL